jgi:hypothetical protein
MITWGSHAGGGGQDWASTSVPVIAAHAYPGHAVAPTAWQVNPFEQSLFWVQEVGSAEAVRDAPSAPSANSRAIEPRSGR